MTNPTSHVERLAMEQAKEPFVVIWSPLNRDAQPDLYEALERLSEPATLKTARGIATKHGLSGLEFQLYEINAPNGDLDGKLGVRVCFDQASIKPGSNTLWEVLDELAAVLQLPSPTIDGQYHATGERRTYHDTLFARQHALIKIYDSRSVPSIAMGGS